MIGLAVGLAFPVTMAAIGALYALYFDPKAIRPRGDWRRLI